MSSNPGGLFVDEGVYYPDDYEQFLLKQTDVVKSQAIAINQRTIGKYFEGEVNTGATNVLPNNNRVTPVFRKVFNFGPLPNAGAKTLAHGLSPTRNWFFFKIYGTASDPTVPQWIPLTEGNPTSADTLSLTVDATDITVTTTTNLSNFTQSMIVLEYMKG